jgi:hypothetical protein
MSRRALVRAGGASSLVGAGLLAGCDLDLRPSPSSRATAPPDADQQIVEAARRELRGLLVRLSSTGGTAALVACHRAQLTALQGRLPAPTATGRPFTRPQIADRERLAAQRFTHWALTCRNGDLARVLACIAAGIRMQPVPRESS